jgi:hypothetical protein
MHVGFDQCNSYITAEGSSEKMAFTGGASVSPLRDHIDMLAHHLESLRPLCSHLQFVAWKQNRDKRNGREAGKKGCKVVNWIEASWTIRNYCY